jgi:hypothetical protein
MGVGSKIFGRTDLSGEETFLDLQDSQMGRPTSDPDWPYLKFRSILNLEVCNQLLRLGRAIAQAVSRRLPTVAARV